MGDHFDLASHDISEKEVTKTRHVIIQVPLVNQCYRWDCGLACVSMILKMLGKSCNDIYVKDLDSLGCGESIWSIDLALLLYQHEVRVTYTTITIGVDAEHAKKSFYRQNFTEDEKRVADMFEVARQKSISVVKRSVGEAELVSHLNDKEPIIALVDWTHMQCLGCDSPVARCWSCVTCHHGPYQGHYVVVCGFDLNERLYFYKNPDSKSHDLCSIPMEQFEKARRSDGTDEDVLFIHTHSETDSETHSETHSELP